MGEHEERSVTSRRGVDTGADSGSAAVEVEAEGEGGAAGSRTSGTTYFPSGAQWGVVPAR